MLCMVQGMLWLVRGMAWKVSCGFIFTSRGQFATSHKLADSAWDNVDGPWDAVADFPLNIEISRFKWANCVTVHTNFLHKLFHKAFLNQMIYFKQHSKHNVCDRLFSLESSPNFHNMELLFTDRTIQWLGATSVGENLNYNYRQCTCDHLPKVCIGVCCFPYVPYFKHTTL